MQDLRDEYVRHFQHKDFVVERQYEAQLSKTLLPRISAADLQKLANRFKPASSCTVKAISHKRQVQTLPSHTLTHFALLVLQGCRHSPLSRIAKNQYNCLDDNIHVT